MLSASDEINRRTVGRLEPHFAGTLLPPSPSLSRIHLFRSGILVLVPNLFTLEDASTNTLGTLFALGMEELIYTMNSVP